MFEMHLLTALLLLFDFEDRSTSIDDGSRRDVMTQRLSSDVATCLLVKKEPYRPTPKRDSVG